MPKHITQPATIEATGNIHKLIREYIGHANTGESKISIARMSSPSGWIEPGQRPKFDEYTVVLKGSLHVEHEDGVLDMAAGEALIARAGEWVRYSTPGPEGSGMHGDLSAGLFTRVGPSRRHRARVSTNPKRERGSPP